MAHLSAPSFRCAASPTSVLCVLRSLTAWVQRGLVSFLFLFLFWVKRLMWNTEANWIAVFRCEQWPKVPEWLQHEGPSHQLRVFIDWSPFVWVDVSFAVPVPYLWRRLQRCVSIKHILCHKLGPWIPEKILGMREIVNDEWVLEPNPENQTEA